VPGGLEDRLAARGVELAWVVAGQPADACGLLRQRAAAISASARARCGRLKAITYGSIRPVPSPCGVPVVAPTRERSA
jgi:hypothetical protein